MPLDAVDQFRAVGDGAVPAELRRAIGERYLQEQRDRGNDDEIERRRIETAGFGLLQASQPRQEPPKAVAPQRKRDESQCAAARGGAE